MRHPENAVDLQHIVDIECIALDVTDPDSIRAAIEKTLSTFGRIDAVVNNAGFGLQGPFELATDEQIERQFQVNVFGVMQVCREILPYFREQKRGLIVNVASVGGRMTFPLYSVYHATKWAVEGFTESLHYELEPLNIRVKLVEPGPIRTDFYTRSQEVAETAEKTAYDAFIARTVPNLQKAGAAAPDGRIVAQTIYHAVTDDSRRIRYPVNTKGILLARRFLPESIFYKIMKTILVK